MAKSSKPTEAGAAPKTIVRPAANRNFRARLVYKSGAIQDLLIVAESTNAFDVMRQGYTTYLSKGAPTSGMYAVNGMIVILWSEVGSFYTWIE